MVLLLRLARCCGERDEACARRVEACWVLGCLGACTPLLDVAEVGAAVDSAAIDRATICVAVCLARLVGSEAGVHWVVAGSFYGEKF